MNLIGRFFLVGSPGSWLMWINFENVVMYPRLRLAFQNFCSVKITKLTDIWEEMEAFLKN